jgi:WD40 repeat protein
VHFIGHGDFDPDSDVGLLALVGEDGRRHLVPATQFVTLLRQARPMPRMVVLNSCSGATTGRLDLFAGSAAALIRGGVAAAAAMQYPISDAAAVAFSRGFYTAIANNRGVDDAVRSGRAAILGLNSETLEWVTPVLYLRGQQTQIFTLDPPLASRSPELLGHGEASRGHLGEDAREPGSDAPSSAAASRAPRGPGEPPSTGPTRAPLSLNRLLTGHKRRWLMEMAENRVSLAFSPEGLLASGAADRTVRLWNPGTGQQLRVITGLTGLFSRALALAFSPDGSMLAGGDANHTVRLWNPAAGTELQALKGHDNSIYGVAFSPDGQILASASADCTIKLWDPASGLELRTLTVENSNPLVTWMYAVAFSPDGDLLASAGRDKMVRLWNPATGTPLRLLQGHTGTIITAAFSPSGGLLATGSDDQTVRLWNPATGSDIKVLSGHEKGVKAVAFRRDGALLASGSADKTVRLWDLATGELVGVLGGHEKAVTAVAFSPDGLLLASGSTDGSVAIWS